MGEKAIEGIERRAGLTPQEFRAEYRDKNKAVILTDAIRNWSGVGLITPDWLRENYGKKRLQLHGATRQWTVGELLDELEDAEGETPYPCTAHVESEWPELLPLCDPLPIPHARPNRGTVPLFFAHRFGARTEIFIGGPHGNFPYAHIEYYNLNAWVNQIYGQKEFWIFLPEHAGQMYPLPPHNWQSQVNVFDPDYEKHPLFRNVRIIKEVIGAGETIYVPASVWHSARSLTSTISIAFDTLDAANYSRYTDAVLFMQERPLHKRIAVRAYLSALGHAANIAERLPISLPW